MEQLVQKLKDGVVKLLEVPTPPLERGQVILRNHFSLISAGTEGSTVKAARKGLLGKARERPQQVKQVFDVIRSQGPVQAYRAVMKKLDAYSPLGYSCAGEVVAVGAGVTEFAVGDRVACGGLSASHSEVVSVPVNLCVKLRPDADLKQAVFNTLGAIAMQGVRQADLRLGENCAVIGLGLLGQLTCLLLRAAGVRVVGVDIDARVVALAERHCTDLAMTRDTEGIEGRIVAFTGGLGCDAAIITAAADSLDPVNFAGAIARKRGTIVVVGAVPTGFDREPHYYRKELQLRMSCSYGPGRYDPLYEEKGIDYPAAYVRWTEKRNMEAFQELLATGRVDVGYLATHVFPLADAPKAYDMLLERSEPFVGLLIAYDTKLPVDLGRHRVELAAPSHRTGREVVNVGFIGAGSYAQSNLLPNLPKNGKVALKGVATTSGTGSRSVGERFGFAFCTGDANDILSDEGINSVFIATRHDSHAAYVLGALQAGKNVFVEKPLCMTPEELSEIESVYRSLLTDHSSPPLLMVGYNRRFAPLVRALKAAMSAGPTATVYRVNAGMVPKDHWIQDPDVGGGRIVGEVCHFVDLLSYLNGALPVSVHAAALQDSDGLHDTVNLSLAYEDGSIGTVCYLANGDKSLPKERLEVHWHGCSAVLDDFRTLTVHSKGKEKKQKLLSQDKGQTGAVGEFVQAILRGSGPPIPFGDIASASRVSFAALESLATGRPVRLG